MASFTFEAEENILGVSMIKDDACPYHEVVLPLNLFSLIGPFQAHASH